MYVDDVASKEEVDGVAEEPTSSREREGRRDALMCRRTCSRTPATSCRLRRPCLGLR
jgi:hypothetical protein